MTTFLTSIGTIITAAMGWLSTVAQTIVGYVPATESVAASWNPSLLTFFVLFGFVGTGIGLVKRIIGK